MFVEVCFYFNNFFYITDQSKYIAEIYILTGIFDWKFNIINFVFIKRIKKLSIINKVF